MLNLQPVRKFLLIKVDQPKKDQEETTKSGIVLVKKSDDRDLQVTSGKIIGVGQDVKDYKVGQTVFYNFFSGNQVWRQEEGGEVVYHFVIETDVLGIER